MDHSHASDAELLAAADEDASAFRALYERYARRIMDYHLRRCRNPQAALDLTAETFAQVWCARRRFRGGEDGVAGPWLYGIARNVLLQSVRRERLEDGARQRLGILTRADEPAVTPEPAWLDDLDELLDALPTDQRAVLELRFVDDLPYERVASRLSITPEAARARVHRALSALRKNPSPMIGGQR